MLKTGIELEYEERRKYDAIQEELRVKRSKDRGTLFEKMIMDFVTKYKLDMFFFDENFFASLATEYHSLGKRSVEYYNNTNKEISSSRITMLRRYGFQSDKDYREALQYDATIEIAGLPNYLNPDTSLTVIKKKMADPFYDYFNQAFREKLYEVLKKQIVECKSGVIPFINEDGSNCIETLALDYQNLMFSFLSLRLNANEIIDYKKIAFGRIKVEDLESELFEILGYRDEKITTYTRKQEYKDIWKRSYFKPLKEAKNLYKELENEYIRNKQIVFGYHTHYDLEGTLNAMEAFDERKYASRISLCQLFTKNDMKHFLLIRPFFSYERKYSRKIKELLPLRYINMNQEKLAQDLNATAFKSMKCYDYEELCENVNGAISNLYETMKYVYEMNDQTYNEQIIDQLINKENEYRVLYNMTEDAYHEFEDNRIKTELGEQYLEGYEEKKEEVLEEVSTKGKKKKDKANKAKDKKDKKMKKLGKAMNINMNTEEQTVDAIAIDENS